MEGASEQSAQDSVSKPPLRTSLLLVLAAQQVDGGGYYCPDGWCKSDEYCCSDGVCCKVLVDNWHVSIVFGLLFILVMGFGMWILFRRWHIQPRSTGYVFYPQGYMPVDTMAGLPVYQKRHRPKCTTCSPQPKDEDFYPTTEPWTQYHPSEDPVNKPHPVPSQYRTPQYETTLQQASSFYHPSSPDEPVYQRTPTAPPPSP